MSQPIDALEELAALVMAAKRRKYPAVPPFALVRPKFTDRTANGLTKAVMTCLELHGCYVTRVQSQGQYRQGHYTYGTTRRGTADLHAVAFGQHLSIEIKAGKDRLSKAQLATAQQVRQAGGIYLVARNFETFWFWFKAFKERGGTGE